MLDLKNSQSLENVSIIQSNKTAISSKNTDEHVKNSSPTLKRGHWSEKEHELFIEAIKIYGNRWNYVQNHIQTRRRANIISHS